MLLSVVLAPKVAIGQAAIDALATIDALQCQIKGSQVVASFHLVGALGDEDRSSLESGIKLTFVHRVSLYRRRVLFFDKQLASRTVEVSATLDTLTKQYTLTRSIDGGAATTSSADDFDGAQKWLTEVAHFTLPIPDGEARETLELRVSSEYRHIYAVYLFPHALSANDKKGCRP